MADSQEAQGAIRLFECHRILLSEYFELHRHSTALGLVDRNR